MDHDFVGVMYETNGDLNNTSAATKGNILSGLGRAGVGPKRELKESKIPYGKGTVQTVGKVPENFDGGKVIPKPPK